MSYKIECPDWGLLKEYQSDTKDSKNAPVFHFRVNYYPYYIAHLVNDNRNGYIAVENFFKQWRNVKFQGTGVKTHTRDPPSNITALLQNAFDEYLKNPYTFSAQVKLQINFMIGIIKKWTKYKKFLKPVEDVKKDIIGKLK